MMPVFFYEGMTCPVCEKAFQKDDDIVSCPHCGLPHHRSCWLQVGDCHLRHLHGTPEQWSRDNVTARKPQEPQEKELTRRCPQCGADNPEFAEFCKRCGRTISQADWQSAPSPSAHEYTPFTAPPFQRQTYADNDYVDDIAAKDYAAVVGVKAEYYIPRFKRIVSQNTGGWNWSAFLLCPYWLLYRKMYLSGILMVLLQLAESLTVGYVFHAMEITSYDQLYLIMMKAAYDRTVLLNLLPLFVIFAIITVAHIMFGAFGNQLYKKHCSSVIRRARERVPDISASELATTGGTSMGVAIIGYFALSFLSQLTTLIYL